MTPRCVKHPGVIESVQEEFGMNSFKRKTHKFCRTLDDGLDVIKQNYLSSL